jgi:hypothetical protein
MIKTRDRCFHKSALLSKVKAGWSYGVPQNRVPKGVPPDTPLGMDSGTFITFLSQYFIKSLNIMIRPVGARNPVVRKPEIRAIVGNHRETGFGTFAKTPIFTYQTFSKQGFKSTRPRGPPEIQGSRGVPLFGPLFEQVLSLCSGFDVSKHVRKHVFSCFSLFKKLDPSHCSGSLSGVTRFGDPRKSFDEQSNGFFHFFFVFFIFFLLFLSKSQKWKS